MPSGPERAVLACDLDETLLRVNTFPLFVGFALRQLLVQRDTVGWMRLVVAVARRKLLGGSHVSFKAAVHGAGRRLGSASVCAWAHQVFRTHVNGEVLARVQAWPGDTVLVTAAPSVYADLIGTLAGFTLVQASDYLDGDYVENVHVRKAQRLKDALTGPLGCAITDDVRLDGPLLMLAAEPLLVDRSGAVHAFVSPA